MFSYLCRIVREDVEQQNIDNNSRCRYQIVWLFWHNKDVHKHEYDDEQKNYGNYNPESTNKFRVSSKCAYLVPVAARPTCHQKRICKI